LLAGQGIVHALAAWTMLFFFAWVDSPSLEPFTLAMARLGYNTHSAGQSAT
jgi:hypothetical protein